jgi:gamma-glutamyltranspeptidase / glutathione hydrolase
VKGVIAAGDHQTCAAGIVALEAGGTAVDAVLAAAFASFVVEPPLTSPAGAGVLLHGHPDRGFEIMDFFATTPGRGLSTRPPLDFQRVTVDFGAATQHFHVGRAAAAIPGALPGLLATHSAYGTLPLRDILAPAIAYARHGYQLSTQVRWVNELLRPIVTLTEGVRDIFCDGDDIALAGSTQTNRPFADFLDALATDPRDARRDFDAAILGAFGPQNGGLITAEDLDTYKPTRRRPLQVSFRGAEILTNPPPASGGGLIAFALRLLETMDLGPFLSTQHLTSMAKTFRAVSEARLAGYDANISDPATVAALLSDANLDSWVKRLAARQEETQLGGTTHISVLDAQGGAAAMTASNGEGCGYVLPDLGIHMNNFLGEEDINPLGFHRFEAGARMTTMMAPTLVLRNGEPQLVLGSGGSNRIRSAITSALVNALHFGQDPHTCVNAPRLHVEGDQLWFEAEGTGPGASDTLGKLWPAAARFDGRNMFFGGVHMVGCTSEGLVGGGDLRRGGTVAFAGVQ